MVTFEFALVVPLLLLVCLAACWVLRLGQLQAQVQDAARTAAREAARGASADAARAAAGTVLPGVWVEFHEDGESVAVDAAYNIAGPPLVWRGLDRRLRAQATAMLEPPYGR